MICFKNELTIMGQIKMIVGKEKSENYMECIRHKKIISLPQDDKKALEFVVHTLNDAGYECFLVGGSVRDIVLQRSVYDYDFATNAHPKKVMNLFSKAIPTGIKHGTVTVIVDGMNFEITTYRADGKYVDGRRPETVTFSDTLEEDIIRRDFTINGLAYDIRSDEVIDIVNCMVYI
jgi:tRNA nucleotidyltransferase (CCA-adding enzyme)